MTHEHRPSLGTETAPEVAVLAGRSKTGRALQSALEARGVGARLIGRAESDRLAEAMAGCLAVYVMAPNLHPDEPALVAAALKAAEVAGVERVVYHSVASPYVPAMPHHMGKAISEDLVRRGCDTWTILQPCAYTQNFVPHLRETEPVLRVPYDPDRRFGLVDLHDVADAAAAVLLDPEHIGATYELGGPDLIGVTEVGATASRILGRSVPVQRVGRHSDNETDERETAWLQAMFDYYDRHGLPAGSRALASLLGRAPNNVETTLRRELAVGEP